MYAHPKIARRAFLQTVGGALTASSISIPQRLYGSFEGASLKPSTDGKVAVRFLEAADVLICGSTLFACQLALECARSGKKTALVMDRVNPFFEGITCLRSWISVEDAVVFPEVVRGVLAEATSETKDGRIYFNAFKASLEIEDRLSEAGVRFLYNASVAGALGRDGNLSGCVFGGKTGLFAIESSVVVDATAESTVARAVGARADAKEGMRRYHYVVDLAAPVPPRSVQYQSTDGAKVSVEIHHYYAEFEVEFKSANQGPLALLQDFDRVYAAALQMDWKGSEKRFRGADGFLCGGVDGLRCANAQVDGISNLLVFGPAGISGNRDGSLVLKDWRAMFRAFPDALMRVKGVGSSPWRVNPVYTFWNKGVAEDKELMGSVAHSFEDRGFSEPDSEMRRIAFQSPEVVDRCQTIVIGGGTSGNAAAYASAKLGMKTLCLERGYELGGSNTIGGVTNLWYGNKTKGFDDYYSAMGAKNDGLNAPGFYRGIREAGASLLFGCAITGVAVEGRNLRRVYLTTPFGLAAVEGERFIDATGDGALAAWAGCAYTFGGEHDELTLWASFAAFLPGKPEALRPFLSPCDERSALDATRFVLSMRRNSKLSGDKKHIHPPFYLAPRESRHIRGGKTLTFLDLLAGRRFKDGVFRVESNPDIKGLATSDAAKSGLIPTNWRALFRATVPYAAMLPEGLDNLIIAGKAYSATHDALSAARMQRDLCVMGMVAAHAVDLAVRRSTLLRAIPIRELQQTLIAKGMLKEVDVAEDDLGFGMTPEEMARKVATKSTMDEALIPSAMLCLIPRETAVSALTPYLKTANSNIHRVGAYLCVPESMDRYVAEVERALKESALSAELFGGEGTKHLMPDQGYAPVSALMLGSLVHAREKRAVALLVQLAEKAEFKPDDLRSAWGYLYTLACGFERLACEEGRTALGKVLRAPLFENCLVQRASDLRACRDTLSERLAYLRMALSRALLRCGDAQGGLHLCEFLGEGRLCLARAARAELVAASGKDFGFRAEAWRNWFDKQAHTLRVNPLTQPFA